MRATKRAGALTTAVIALISILLLATPTANAEGAAAEPPASPGVPITCETRPPTAGLAVEDCERFVALWAPRMADQAWLESWVALDAVPADIAAEGFHDIDQVSKGWLIGALAEEMIATRGADGDNPGVRPPDAELLRAKSSMALIIFGKAQINDVVDDFTEQERTDEGAADTPSVLAPVAEELADTPTTEETVETEVPSPAPPATTEVAAGDEVPAVEEAPSSAAASSLAPPSLTPPPLPMSSASLLGIITDVFGTPGVLSLTGLLSSLLAVVGDIEQRLFTLPVVGSVVGGLTYRVCGESPTMPLSCSINLPVGVPIPADLTGDFLPDVLAQLIPTVKLPVTQIVSLIPLKVNLIPTADVGFRFEVGRLFPNGGALPAHIFAVYDPPVINKRIEIGFDGRDSTLAKRSEVAATVKNIANAVTGDVEVVGQITNTLPGATLALTAAVKDLVPQGALVLPLEKNPMAAKIHFNGVPTSVTANAHLIHKNNLNRDTITLDSNLNSIVTASVIQKVDTVSPNSVREYQAVINRLPSHVSVDLLNQNPKQTITYGATSVIDQIDVYQKSTDDTSHPDSFTLNQAQILGLPKDVQLTLTGAEDILFAASSTVPQVSFITQTKTDAVLQKQITAQANGVPKNIHIKNVTLPDKSTISYDGDSSLDLIQLGLYDLANDKTIVNAEAAGFPLHLQLDQTKSTGATDYTASGPIESIKATVTRADGTYIPLPGVDHATVKVVDDAIGLDLQLSGLAGAHIDPSEEASYGLQLSPGGQPFEAIAELNDPNRTAHVTVSNLPSSLQLDLDPIDGSATYTASQVIDQIDARYEQVDDGTIGHVIFDDVPKVIGVTWDTSGSVPDITYSADGRLGGLSAYYQEQPGGTTFEALVLDLPRFMRFSGVDAFVFDARSAPAAPSASDHVGQIQVRYASDGTLVTTGNPVDHLYLDNSVTDVTKAELVYSGLELASASTEDDEVHVRVENSAPRRFEVNVGTPELTLAAFVEKVPDMVQIDVVGEAISYEASTPIDEIAVDIDRLNGDLISLGIEGLPTSIDLVLDTSDAEVSWVASGETGAVRADAELSPATNGTPRTINVSLDIVDIPAQWNGSFDEGHVLFDGVTSAIGEIVATFTNHGTYTSLPGSGISAQFDEPAGDLDAYLRITELDRAEFQKVAPSGGGAGGFDANLDMGSGEQFDLDADIVLDDGTRLSALGSLSNLPTLMHLRQVDGLLTYTGNSNPTIDLDVSFGPSAASVAAVPAPPQVHGISVRDGSSGGNLAVKASLYITGLPNSLSFDSEAGVYTVGGFNPSVDTLTIDADLDHAAAEDIDLLAVQDIGAGPVTFTFGPFTSDTVSGAKVIHAGYSASRAMGSLTADVALGADAAHLFVSNIPTLLAFDASFGDATKSIVITAGQPIDELTATYKGTLAGSFTAGVTLGDIPTSVNLIIGEQGDAAGVQTPAFSYNASASTLDIDAFLDDAVFGPASGAGFTLAAVDLGATLAANLVNTTNLIVGSNPATQSFTLVAHAQLHFDIDIGFDAGPFHNEGNVGIDLDVDELTIAFTDMTALDVRLGYSTGVGGSFGSFTFGEKSDTEIAVNSNLDLEFSVFGVDVDFDLADVNIDLDLGNVIGDFRLADDHLDDWLSIPLFIPCGFDLDLNPIETISVIIELRPHPHGTTFGSAFTVHGGNPAWVATVNPLGVVPDRITDIIARFTTPYTGDQGLDASCD